MTPDGLLLEYFDAAWAPAAGLQGRLAWPGHQFEWAGLLERWALRRGREDVRAVARRLYRYGADHGIDPKRGVAVYELLDDLSVNDAKARLWSQTEWLKAALILARSASGDERQRYLADAIAAAKALMLYSTRRSPDCGATSCWPTGAGSMSPRRRARSIISSTRCVCWLSGRIDTDAPGPPESERAAVLIGQ